MESARCKAFIESAERGNFRAAADALGYTPATLAMVRMGLGVTFANELSAL